GAHLEALRRTRVGGFDVEDAVPLDVVDREGREAAARMLPMETLLPALPSVRLTEAGETRVRHGNVLGLTHVATWENAPAAAPETAAGQPIRYRVLDGSGRLMAVAQATPAGLQPFIVLAGQPQDRQ
ncbi:MAG TPA: hypothetical protein VFZ36_08760, partial [Vicinamibacterales bacterium]